MKKLTADLARVLRCRKGESLMESIISILLFTVLMAAVTTMIMLSLRITGNYTATASGEQERVNDSVLEADHTVEGLLTITGTGIDVEIEVYHSAGNPEAFSPVAP